MSNFGGKQWGGGAALLGNSTVSPPSGIGSSIGENNAMVPQKVAPSPNIGLVTVITAILGHYQICGLAYGNNAL